MKGGMIVVWIAEELLASARVGLATGAACLAFCGLVWAFAQALLPWSAEGSLLRDESSGAVVGSLLVAQPFVRPEYLWPRPSACGYDASAPRGSGLCPASDELRGLAAARVAAFGAEGAKTLPADLVTASGSGLDPHLSWAAAKLQVERIAAARGLSPASVEQVLTVCSDRSGGPLSPGRLVNVLYANSVLKELRRTHE